jgi:GNAT superfamily N-acetyltransferase
MARMARKEVGRLLVVEEYGEIIAMIGLAYFPCFFNNKETFAQELFWYTTPSCRGNKAGKVLRNYAEQVCREDNINKICMASLRGKYSEILDKVYKDEGYELIESNYIREL